ncbi:Uncharacterised protein [Escherichia coli]|nr:Uncharacterised protein [Escherichia coli]
MFLFCDDIHDDGCLTYAANQDYSHCDSWFVIDVDLSEIEGKQQRINIALPDVLIRRIDGFVRESAVFTEIVAIFLLRPRGMSFHINEKSPLDAGIFLPTAAFQCI